MVTPGACCGLAVCSPTSDVDGKAEPGNPVAGHPFATDDGWHGVVRPQPGGVNQIPSTTPPQWGSDLWRPRVLAAPGCVSRRAGLQAADVPVAQPPVDQREQLTGGGDLGDVGPAPLGDAGPGRSDRPAVHALHRLDRGPPHQVVALLGDPTTVDLGVRLPGPWGNLG